MTLAHLTKQYRALTAAIEEAGGVITQEQGDALAELRQAIEAKLLPYHRRRSKHKAFIAASKAEIKRLQALVKRDEATVDGLTRDMIEAVKLLGKTKGGSVHLRLPLLKLRVSTTTETFVENYALVPEKYWRVTTKREPDKARIKAVLACPDGEVPGCRLKTNYNLYV